MDLYGKEMLKIRVMMFLAILVLLQAGFRGEHSILDYFELRESREVLLASVASMKEDIRALELEIEKIKESPDYARKVLRDQFHITDSHENIIFFPD